MTPPTVSVIVVSRGRPDALRRCLMGLEQLFYRPFEVVVVADPAGIAAITDWHSDIKFAEFDQANISAARNIGARLAAGDILAFIDDDAVPEPSWLDHLIPPFGDQSVGIAGGYVLGRDGVNYQYRASQVDRFGNGTDLHLSGDAPEVFDAPPEGAIKTEGTNFAIRRAVLVDIGGFDEVYRYYLDETDLNMRLAGTGAHTAIVPLALVHHGFAASERRTRHSRALTLFDIGASLRVFLRKHAPGEDHTALINELRSKQQFFQEKHRKAGRCTRAEVVHVLQTLDDGLEAGRTMAFGRYADLGKPDSGMKLFGRADRFTASVVLSGRIWRRGYLMRKAARRVAAGERVTLILLEPSRRYLRVNFVQQGFWLHSGGQFGRAGQGDRKIDPMALGSRVQQEIARVRFVRGLAEF